MRNPLLAGLPHLLRYSSRVSHPPRVLLLRTSGGFVSRPKRSWDSPLQSFSLQQSRYPFSFRTLLMLRFSPPPRTFGDALPHYAVTHARRGSLIFRASPGCSPSFWQQCYLSPEPATLLGFPLSMALSLVDLKKTSQLDPSYASPLLITKKRLHSKGFRSTRSVCPSERSLFRRGPPAILRFATSS